MPEEIIDGQEEPQAQGEEQPEEVSTSEEPTEAPQEEEAQLPEDTKERTREQFEKLKAHNAELKRQLEQKQSIPSVLDYLTPQEVPVPQYVPQVQPQYPVYQPQVQPEPQLVDEQGYVNTDVLKRELEEAKKARLKAEEAERRALEAESRISRFEQDAETKRLYQEYPELDPLSEVFNKDAYDLVRNELTSQIVNSGNRDALKAAERMSKYFRTQPPKNQQVLEQRKQVTSVQASSSRPMADDDYELLKKQSRNDPEAMLKRLEANGY